MRLFKRFFKWWKEEGRYMSHVGSVIREHRWRMEQYEKRNLK